MGERERDSERDRTLNYIFSVAFIYLCRINNYLFGRRRNAAKSARTQLNAIDVNGIQFHTHAPPTTTMITIMLLMMICGTAYIVIYIGWSLDARVNICSHM